jgi:excisionase family DNA binding protein
MDQKTIKFLKDCFESLQTLAHHPEQDEQVWVDTAGLVAEVSDLARLHGAGHLAEPRTTYCPPERGMTVVGRILEWMKRPKMPAALLAVEEVASILDVSPSHVYRLADGGKMPRPVKMGALARWVRADLESWIAGGCKSIRNRG